MINIILVVCYMSGRSLTPAYAVRYETERECQVAADSINKAEGLLSRRTATCAPLVAKEGAKK